MTITLERAARATNGAVRSGAHYASDVRVVTDTRSIQAGDTFLALRGERFDGHAYAAEAVRKGASLLIVDEAGVIPDGTPALVVADTKRAYMDLAALAREDFGGRVIGITGSTGKTTTKYLLGQLLSAKFGPSGVLASPGNENNEIGVSKLMLSIANDVRVLVVEMGARHEGEIAELAQIARPHIGILTNIGEAHLEIFGSHERLAETKWGLFSTGAQAVLNAADAESVTRAKSLGSPPFWFGAGEPCNDGVWIRDERTLVVAGGAGPREVAVDVRLPGAHNRANLAAAVAGALLAGVDVERIAGAIPQLELPAGRFERIDLAGGAYAIYDAYNANLSGMLAALDAFALQPAGRRIAVLSSMAELGAEAAGMHERVGAHAAELGLDMLLLGGDFRDALEAGALAAGYPPGNIVLYQENTDAARWLAGHAGSGDAVLLKGSRKYAMEQIVEALRAREAGRA